MAKRKKQLRGNHPTARGSAGDGAKLKRASADADELPPARPPKPNRALMMLSLVLMVGWLVFLAVVAAMS